MRYFLKTLLVFALAALSGPSLAQRYFGYFANSDSVTENYDHTNMTFVYQAHASPSTATANIISELNYAKSKNLKAMVMVESFLFDTPFTYGYNAPTRWNAFVNALIAAGHLSYNNPNASTVAAFYIVDEPDLSGLKDSGGQAHPAFSNAIATVKNHPATSSFPTAGFFSKRYNDAYNAVRLLDWAGMDNYTLDDAGYISAFNTFQSILRTSQRSMLIPQAASGGSMMSSYGAYNSPDAMYNYFSSNSKAVVFMPFLWRHFDTFGVRDQIDLKNSYKAIGYSIKTNGPAPLLVSGHCSGPVTARICTASASRGLAPYRFDWTSEISSYSSTGTTSTWQFSAGCVRVESVDVIVTDARGTKRSLHVGIFCPVPGDK